tara:strand:- start:221 stop:820 length:600 start_codon:yes stop_codon:yes gene_type:complete
MKIGIFLLPPASLKNKILRKKEQIKTKFGNQTYLSHLPHLTVYLFETSNKNIDSLKKIKIFNFKKNIKFTLNNLSLFENDIKTNKTTIFYKINKHRNHNYFQKGIIDLFHQYLSLPQEKINYKNKKMIKSYYNYGYPFIGINWKPHFTIASISKKTIEDEYFKNLLKTKIKFEFIPKKIAVYKILGNKHILLNFIKINK